MLVGKAGHIDFGFWILDLDFAQPAGLREIQNPKSKI